MPLNRLDTHFLKMAQSQASAHTDGAGGVNKKRGAVIAKDNRILATGVSSHLGGDLISNDPDEKYVATVNAELVAVGSLIRAGHSIGDVTIYVTDCPNWITFKVLVTLGIKRIVHYGICSNERIPHYARQLGVELVSVG